MRDERPVFELADDPQSCPVPAPWAGGYLALGARLARYADGLDSRQLIVVLSVPRRDFVAVLVGAGWALTRPPKAGAGNPAAVTAGGGTGLWYRAVNSSYVYNGKLSAVDETTNPPRIRFAGSNYRVDGFQLMAVSSSLEEDIRQARPVPGSITRFSGADREWDDRLVAPAQDLALIGIETRLRSDLEAILVRGGESEGESLEALLLPWERKAATWFSRIHSSASLDAFPPGYGGVILDGQGAIKFIEEILSPVVVCIVDRSVADETQVVNLVNKRITEGAEVSASAALEWKPPTGVEVMAFEVRL